LAGCENEPKPGPPEPGTTPIEDTTTPADSGSASATADTGPPADSGADTGSGLPAWLEGTAEVFAGGSVSVADVDGDGVAELAVGGQYTGWVVSGPYADGRLDDVADLLVYTSYTVALLPDLTGDGVGDLITESWSCGADIYAGPFPGAAPDAFAVIETADLGETFVRCGDADGDGDADLCAGTDANCSIYGVDPAARVYALPLPPAALGPEDALVTFAFGLELEIGSVDLDDDGQDEFVVAAPDAAGGDGTVWWVRAPPLGPYDLAQADAVWTGSGGGELGTELARADLDGDGGEDLAIGGPRWADGADTGYYGSPSVGRAWVATSEDGGSVDGLPITVAGDDGWSDLALAVACGDPNGDGAADLVVSQVSHRPPEPGRVGVFLGPLAPGSRSMADADAVLVGWGPNDYYGVDVAIGDLDGDGVDDLAIGGTGDRGGVDRPGAVHLLPGAGVFP
jgi:hypothetical protein